MSFATRCSTCGTIFRVVQDQLKVSDGWVRCGRCDAVFDAAGSLFDLEREAPPDWRPAPPPAVPEPAAAEPIDAAGNANAEAEPTDDERRWSASMAAQGMAIDDGPVEPVGAPASPAFPEPLESPASRLTIPSTPSVEPQDESARFDPVDPAAHGHHEDDDDDEIVIIDHPSSLRSGAATTTSAELDATDVAGPTESDAPPGFMRQAAARPATWQTGRARAVLGLLAVLLVVTLGMQAVQQQSELLAARWPALQPALTAWCGLARCSVGPPHRIDDIVVENTALSPVAPAGTPATGAASAPSALRLAVTLRNRAGYAVALPSIDLSLTDISGKLIARRALSPADFQVVASAVPASSELPMQAVLTTMSTAAGGAPAPVSGYTVEIFYP